MLWSHLNQRENGVFLNLLRMDQQVVCPLQPPLEIQVQINHRDSRMEDDSKCKVHLFFSILIFFPHFTLTDYGYARMAAPPFAEKPAVIFAVRNSL